ncbi:retrovirus-related pol polyprotein from transposon TNT 1-94 [Tanacetum coccineum]
MNSLRAIQSQLKFLIETLQDVGNMPIFKRTFSQDLDLLENHLTKEIISQTDCKTTLTKLRTTFEIKYKMSKAKERCMAYFQSIHSHLQVLSKDDLKGTRIEHGFKRAFMSLFGQDVDTFTRTMLLNVDQLQKQLDKDEFQEDGSMTAFWVSNDRHETSTARTPEQNGVVERRNRTLVEAAQTMLSAAKVPLFFWAESIAT